MNKDAKTKSGKSNAEDSERHVYAERLAKIIALHCVRNSYLEDLHAGIFPSSKTGDYSDVKVVTPYGEIPWNKLGRISDDEMKALNKDVINKLFTFLYCYVNDGTVPVGLGGFYEPKGWDQAEFDEVIKKTWSDQ